MANLSNINGKFVVEQTTGFVGVGTTDPNYPIEVLNASAEIALNASGASIYRLRSDSTDSFRINKNGVGDRLVISGGGDATFSGTISSKDISIKQADDSGFDGGLTIERSANTQKVHIGMDGGAVNFNSPGGLSYKFRNNGTEKFIVDGSGNATVAGKVSVGGGDTSTAQVALKGQQSLLSFERGTSGDAKFFMSSDSSRLYFSHTDIQNTNLILKLDASNKSATFLGDIEMVQTSGNNSLTIDSSGGGAPVIYLKDSSKTWGQFVASGDLYFKNETTNVNTLILSGSNATFAGSVTAPTFLGDLNGTINTVTTATTKGNATNDTTVATTAFVQNVVGTIPAGLVFQGTWNAATNTPTLTSGSGTTGNFYIVSVAGSTNLDGITDWQVGDWAVFIEQGASDQWEKIDNSSVLGGSGTGGSFAGWSGSGTSVTLGNAPVTFSGNNSTFAGDLYVPNKLIHVGDTNTWIQFETDVISLRTGGTDRLTLTDSTATFAGNVHLADEKILGFRSTNDYAIQYRDLDFRFIGSADGTTNRLFSFGHYTSDNPAGTWNGKVYINSFTGNVGIGIQTPTLVAGKIVHIHGVAAGIHLTDTASGTANTDGGYVAFDNPHLFIQNKEAGDIRFETSATTRLTIDSSGKVGIGTASPAEKLEVSGSIKVGNMKLEPANGGRIGFNRNTSNGVIYDSNYAAFQINGASSGNDFLEIQNYNSSGNFLGSVALKNGKFGIGTTSPDNILTLQAAAGSMHQRFKESSTTIGFIGGANGIISGHNGKLALRAESGLVLSSQGNAADVVISSGNVTFAADIEINDSGQIYLGTGNDAQIYHNGSHLFIDNSTGNSYFRNTSTSGIIIRNSNGGDIQLDNEFAGKIFFTTSNVERMRITPSGNISIDRTTDSVGGAPGGTDGRLNVYTDEGSSAWAQQMRHDSTTGNGLFIRAGASSSYYTAYFAGYDESNVHFVVRGDGNVGVGTASPTNILQVHQSDASSNSYLHITHADSGSAATDGLSIGLESDGVNAAIRNRENGYLRMFTNNTERVRVNADGTTKFYANIHVDVINNANNSANIIYRSGTSTLVGGGSTANKLYVLDNGNIGIGATDPEDKLEVANGALKVKASANHAEEVYIKFGRSDQADGNFENHIKSMTGSGTTQNKMTFSLCNTSATGRNNVLTLDGSNSVSTFSGDVVAFSDKKLKENIKTLDGSKVYDMRGVSFDRIDTGKASSGVIAQEIKKIAPELVNESDGTLGVAYGNLTGYLIEAIKELKAEVEELKKHKCDCKK